MGYSLLLLHVLIKCPEINRNYLPVVIIPQFQLFQVFPDYFNAKFTTILPLTLNGTVHRIRMVVLNPTKKGHGFRLGLGCYKMNLKLYVKDCKDFLIDTLVVTLRAAHSAWPWSDIILKKGAYRERLRQAHLNWFLYRVMLEIGYDWTFFQVRKLDSFYDY